MKVLVTANFTDEGLARLKGVLGMEVVHDPWSAKNRILMSEELAEMLSELKADAVILEVDLCHEEVFEEVPLKFVGCCRGDPINVDVEEATDRGVPVLFTPGRNADAVADLAVGLMICGLRSVIPVHNLLVSGNFDPESIEDYMAMFKEWTGSEVGGRTVGIVGLGAVGSAVARRLKPFGPRMLGYDPFAPGQRFEELGVVKTDLPELFKDSDIVTIHAAINDDTMGMITRELLESMRPGAMFVNLARAELVDDDALYEAIAGRRIGLAALDVFRTEPPTRDDRMLKLKNVIVTPHIAGNTHDVIRHQTEILLADLEALLSGGLPRHCANPEVLKK